MDYKNPTQKSEGTSGHSYIEALEHLRKAAPKCFTTWLKAAIRQPSRRSFGVGFMRLATPLFRTSLFQLGRFLLITALTLGFVRTTNPHRLPAWRRQKLRGRYAVRVRAAKERG